MRCITHFSSSPISVGRISHRVGLRIAVTLGAALVSCMPQLSGAPARAQARSVTTPPVQLEHVSGRPTATQDGRNEQTLEPGKPIEQGLAGGESHTYRIHLTSGQFMRAVVDVRGFEALVELFGPDGKKLYELYGPSPIHGGGRQPISAVADAPGSYRLEVRSREKLANPWRYELKVEELRAATPQDRRRVAADMAAAEGTRLYIQPSLSKMEPSRQVCRSAIEKYEEALSHWRAVGNRAGEASTLHSIGNVYHGLNEPQKALDFYDQALTLRRAEGDLGGEGGTLIAIGDLYLDRFFDKRKALEFYERALPLVSGAGDRRGEADVLNKVGYVNTLIGENLKALDRYLQALPLRRAMGDNRLVVTLNNLGWVYNELGEKQKALDYHNQALPLWGDSRGDANSLFNIGKIYDELGEKQKALNFFRRALPLWQAYKDLREGNTLNHIGKIYIDLGEPVKALDYLNSSLRLIKSWGDGNGRKVQVSILCNIGQAYRDLGEPHNALAFLNQALSLSRSVGDRPGEAFTLLDIGTFYGESGQPRKALDFYDQALKLMRVAGNVSGEAATLYGIARAERDCGDLAAARRQIEAALKIVESLRAKIASHELRAAYFVTVRDSYEFYVDMLMRLHKQHPAEGHDAAALQASERARARSLLETLAETGADIREGVDPTLVGRERSLQQRLNAKAQIQMRLQGDPHAKEQAEAIAGEIEALTTELQQVEAHIRQTSPRYATLTQPQPLALAEIQSLLDPDTVLLEYALGPEQSYVWVVTPDALATHELAGRGEIETLALQTYELLTARNRRQKSELPEDRRRRIAEADALYWKKAAELSRLILTPVAVHLKDKRLIVVADGALQKIAFASLPTPQPPPVKSPSLATSGMQADSGARQTPGGMRPLIADHEIVSLPSASVLASLRREAAGRVPAPKAVAVFADPVFDTSDIRFAGKTVAGRGASAPSGSATPARRDDDLESTLRSTGTADDSLSIPRLFASRREAEAIAALAPPGSSLKAVDFDASRALATDPRMRQYRIIHFATHALVNYEHPGLSGLILSLVDERGTARDGFLRLHDIFNLRLNADLVVLSACNTGLGKDIGGEGLVGLTRGFMYAGSPRVIASLWKVDDDATSGLMQRMYQRMLANRQSPAAALRGAQVEMWQQKSQSAPYYWAAFTLQGEWK